MRKTLVCASIGVITFGLTACARRPVSLPTASTTSAKYSSHTQRGKKHCNRPVNPDPYEGFNRFSFALNMDLDHLLLRPAAKVYNAIIPPPLKKGVTNVFDNIEELTTIPNDLLQGKIRYFFTDLWRLIINTTFGIGGLFDVATRMGLPKHYEDFGLTFAHWSGATQSPYFVIPVLGPSTYRAAFGKIFEISTSPWFYFDNAAASWSTVAINAINIRSQLLPADRLLDTAFDPYVMVRNAYLQKRNQMITNNEIPYKTKRERDQ